MDLSRLSALAPLLILVLSSAQGLGQGWGSNAQQLEIYGVVSRVIDGDTVDLHVLAVYKDRYASMNGTTIRVRLADINAPELGTPEGEEAKRALASLLSGKGVYLDVDDIYVRDRYGRVVAVVYLPLNSTHAMNVNLWLVLGGYASIVDYQNEFTPTSWRLYIELPTTDMATSTAGPRQGSTAWAGGYALAAIVALIAIAALIAALIARGSRR